MENRIWGDSIREYENLNTLNLLETIQDLKIKNNELQSALDHQKKIADALIKNQIMTCEQLAEYIVENDELKRKLKYQNVENPNYDPSDPRD